MTLTVPELIEVVARGRAVARAAGAVRAEIVCRAFEAMATADMGDPDAGAEIAVAAAADALAAEEPFGFGYALFAASVCDMGRGRFAEVLARMEMLVGSLEEVGLMWGSAWAHTLVGQVHWIMGDFSRSLAAYARGEEVARRSQSPNVMPLPMIGTSIVLASQSRRDPAAERLAEARSWLDERGPTFLEPWYWQAAGMIAEIDGDLPAAAAHYRRMVEILERRGMLAQFPMRARLVDALARAGHPAEAYKLARGYVARLQGKRMPFGEAALDMASAVALRELGRAADAVEVAENALAVAAGMDGAWLPAMARATLGEALLAAGRSAEARAALTEAHDELAAMGAELDRRRVVSLLEGLGVRPRTTAAGVPRRNDRTPEPLAELSVREREVAALAATGASSRAIALRLTLSERTVENHLQHVYSKLGLHSRAELIALVAGTLAARG